MGMDGLEVQALLWSAGEREADAGWSPFAGTVVVPAVVREREPSPEWRKNTL